MLTTQLMRGGARIQPQLFSSTLSLRLNILQGIQKYALGSFGYSIALASQSFILKTLGSNSAYIREALKTLPEDSIGHLFFQRYLALSIMFRQMFQGQNSNFGTSQSRDF